MTPQPNLSGAVCAVHPANSATGTCPRCGNFVCRACVDPALGLMCQKCRELVGPVARQPTPWERRAELGFFTAFFETWKLSLFSPDRFFRSLPTDGKWVDAMLYAWVLGALQAGPALLVQAANFEQLKASVGLLSRGHPPAWLEGMSAWTFAALITLVPMFLYPLSFVIGSGVTHLGCLLVGAGPKGWAVTARVQGYAQGPIVVMWVPLIGPFLGIYLLVLSILGIARAHEVHGGRAAAGVLLIPLLLGCCLGLATVVFIINTMSHLR